MARVNKELVEHHAKMRKDFSDYEEKLKKDTQKSVEKGWMSKEAASTVGMQHNNAKEMFEKNLKQVEDSNAG